MCLSSDNPGYVLAIDTNLEAPVNIIDRGDGNDQFGQAVDLSPTDDSLALIGAPEGTHDGANAPMPGVAWRCTGILDVDLATCEDFWPREASNTVSHDDTHALGASVEIWNGSMTVGDPQAGLDGENVGAVFAWDDGEQVDTIRQEGDTAESSEAGDDFGSGLAYNGDAIWVGSPGEDLDGVTDKGILHIWN